MAPEDQEHESRVHEFVRAIEHPEYERVCTKCATHWEVPSGYVHSAAHVSHTGRALNPQATAAELTSFDNAEQGYDTCPGCGAYKSFTEHRLLLETKDQDVQEKE